MSGVLYVDETAVEPTTGHILLSFKSGGNAIRFHIPAHVTLQFRQAVMQGAWQVCCAPDSEVIELKRKRAHKRKAKPE